jgi:DHA1 family tetracycline resistance protein-like MFS transporter
MRKWFGSLRGSLDRRAWIIFLIVFVDLLGFGIILPFLPYYVESLGAGAVAVGALVSAYSLFQFIASPILGELSDRFGRRPILLYSQAGTVLSFLLMGLTHSLPLLFVARMLDGASGGNVSTAQAYMADITDKTRRTQGMGLLSAAFSLGFILGPALGGVLSRYGYSVPALVAACVSGLAFVLTYFFLPESRQRSRVKQVLKRRSLLRLRDFYDVVMLPRVGLVVVVSFWLMFAFSLMQGTFILLTAETLGMTAEQNGFVFTYVGLLGVILQLFLLKRILRWLSERAAAGLGIALMAAGFALMIVMNGYGMLALAITLVALGSGVSQPVLMGLVSKFSPPDEQGNILGIYQSTGSVARLIGPVTGGFIYSALSPRWPYMISSVILVGTAMVTYRYLHSETVMEKLKAKVKGIVRR